MKLFIFLLLFSLSAVAQTTGNCCPVDTKVDDVIKEDFVATSCLLCNTVHLTPFSKYEKIPDVEGGNSSKEGMKLVRLCQKNQKEIIKNVIEVVNKYNFISNKDKKVTYVSAVEDIMMLYTADLSDQLKQFNSENVFKIGGCDEDKDEKVAKEIIVRKEIDKLAVTINKIYDSHKEIQKRCPDYVLTDQERNIMDLMDELYLLQSKIK